MCIKTNWKEETIDMIDEFIGKNEAFTSLDVSNKLKSGGLVLRHLEIAPVIRDLYKNKDDINNIFGNYDRTEIMVDAEILQDDGSLINENVITFLYHSPNFDQNNYQTRSLRAAAPVANFDDVVDDDDEDDDIQIGIDATIAVPNVVQQAIDDAEATADDDDDVLETIDDEDGAYSYQTKIHKHGVSIYLDALANRDLEESSFSMFLRHQEIVLDSQHGKSVIPTTKSGHLRISNTNLRRTSLSKFDAVWVHINKHYIVINELSPEAMDLRRYIGCLIKFVVDTPQSKTGELTQTAILKVTGVSATKDCNYLLHGYNIKRLVDDAEDLKGALRQYRVDRIDFDTLVELG